VATRTAIARGLPKLCVHQFQRLLVTETRHSTGQRQIVFLPCAGAESLEHTHIRHPAIQQNAGAFPSTEVLQAVGHHHIGTAHELQVRIVQTVQRNGHRSRNVELIEFLRLPHIDENDGTRLHGLRRGLEGSNRRGALLPPLPVTGTQRLPQRRSDEHCHRTRRHDHQNRPHVSLHRGRTARMRGEGIEPSTNRLKAGCSTSELPPRAALI
jgi:hypothetical protein